MAIKFQNKQIMEPGSPSTVTCVMAGAASANVPVVIAPNTDGVLTAYNSAITTSTTSWGITTAAVATSANTQIVVGGKVQIAAGGLTDGYIVSAIAANGTCTASAASATTAGVGLATCSGTNYVILY